MGLGDWNGTKVPFFKIISKRRNELFLTVPFSSVNYFKGGDFFAIYVHIRRQEKKGLTKSKIHEKKNGPSIQYKICWCIAQIENAFRQPHKENITWRNEGHSLEQWNIYTTICM